VRKEFAKQNKGDMDILSFNKWFEQELKQDADFNKRWDLYTRFYAMYTAFLPTRYRYQGSGDMNLYKLFIERDLQLLRPNGYFTLLVQSSIQTDKGSAELRKYLIHDHTLLEILSFENRGYEDFDEKEQKMKWVKFFPDVDNRMKFTIIRARKMVNLDAERRFQARFYMQHPSEMEEKPTIEFNVAMIEKFSPKNFSIMEFRTERDYAITAKIRNNSQLLEDQAITLRSEFHMTSDSHLFNRNEGGKLSKKLYAPLYEGKMIHQFTSSFSKAQYWLPIKDAKAELRRVEERRVARLLGLKAETVAKAAITLDCEAYRLVWRDVANSTNERTFISTILPPNTLTSNTLNYIVPHRYSTNESDNIVQDRMNAEELLWYCSLFNSLTMNYYVRSKVTAHLNLFTVYEIPIHDAAPALKRSIAEQGFMLLAANAEGKEFEELGAELGVSGSFAMRGGEEAIMRRAGLEVQIARDVYGLTAEEWQHIVSTFSYGGDSDTKQELDAVIAASLTLFTQSIETIS
jgi:hypothetical protein